MAKQAQNTACVVFPEHYTTRAEACHRNEKKDETAERKINTLSSFSSLYHTEFCSSQFLFFHDDAYKKEGGHEGRPHFPSPLSSPSPSCSATILCTDETEKQ